MAAGQGVTDYIEVSDFSAGIWQPQLSGAVVLTPPGAAQPDQTEGCIALASGCLAPGPKLVDTYTRTLYNANTTSGYRNPERPTQQVVATAILSPATLQEDQAESPGFVNWERPDHLFVAHCDFYDPANGGDYLAYFMVHGFNLGGSGTITGPDLTVSTTATVDFSGGYEDMMRYGWGTLVVGYSIITGTGSTDFPFPMLFVSYQLASDAMEGTPTDYQIASYPEANAATYSTTDAFVEINGTYAQMPHLTFHQGRIVGARQGETVGTVTYGDSTAAGGVLRHIDALQWNPTPNEGAYESTTFENAFYVPEGGGIASMASMSANTFLIVKQTGGGYVVRGDLARPQVQRLPGLPAALGAGCIPTQTPIGCVFGTRDGVWTWTDGNAVQLLTPQMKGWWWKPGDTIDLYQFSQPKGKFNFRHPYVLIPNDYMFDSAKGALWKLPSTSTGDRAPYYSYEVSITGHVYAFPTYQGAGKDVLYNRYDFEASNHYFSWHSHAIFPLSNRRYRLRELQLNAQGQGDVVVSLLADGTTLWSGTCEVRSSGMQHFRLPIGVDPSGSDQNDDTTITFTGADVTVLIQSGDPEDDASVAPTVHGFKIGYEMEQTV